MGRSDEYVTPLGAKGVRWERWRLAHDMLELLVRDGLPAHSDSHHRLEVARGALDELRTAMAQEALIPQAARP